MATFIYESYEVVKLLSNFANKELQVFKLGLAKSIHHARVLIKQRHIRVRKQVDSCTWWIFANFPSQLSFKHLML